MKHFKENKPVWIDFIYENNTCDLLLGENFALNYTENEQKMQITFDCSGNLNGPANSNNTLDAMDFINNYTDRLAALRLFHRGLAEYMMQIQREKNIHNNELQLILDKVYIYKVTIQIADGKLIFNVII